MGKIAKPADVDGLLGSGGGRRGALRMTSLRWHPHPASPPVVTLNWGSTAVEPGERRPLSDTLRTVEHVAAGHQFIGEILLPNDEGGDGLKKMLERLLARVDTLGSQRNRNAGAVRLKLDPVANSLPDTGQQLPEISGRVLRLCLRNLDPLCIPATGYPGNLIESLPFVRGQTLRGALTDWALRQGSDDAVAALSVASIGDAMPLPEHASEKALERWDVVPIPLAIMSGKPIGGDPDVPWWADTASPPWMQDDLDLDRQPFDEKPKRPGAREYIVGERDDSGGRRVREWSRFSPLMRVRLRHQSADIYQLTKDSLAEPALFSMEEIAEDTLFLTDLVFPSVEAARQFTEAFKPLLLGCDWLGIGREARPCEVAALTSLARIQGDAPLRTDVQEDSFTLTLTSDLIARGPTLGFLSDLDPAHLVELCGLERDDLPNVSSWSMEGHAESLPVHGYNAASGMRRLAALAIRRGSCWRIQGPGCRRLAEHLDKRDALGERAEEGYGRFRLDLHPVRFASPVATVADVPCNEEEALARRAWEFADDHPGAYEPSASQLQALRSRALACKSVEELSSLLEEFQKAPSRRPKGADAWKHYPFQELRKALDEWPDIHHQRQLVALLVQRTASAQPSKSEEGTQS